MGKKAGQSVQGELPAIGGAQQGTDNAFPRRVLLCLAGLSPAVVTETIYALLLRTPRFVPTEILLLTTVAGKAAAERRLLGNDGGAIGAVFAHFGLARTRLRFGKEQIKVLPGANGRPLQDIRNAQDSVAVGDFLAQTVRKLAADPQCAIHASLAGGRKTMVYYLGAAMSLYGRAQDALSHVLVSPPFDTLPEFFFPEPGRRLRLPDGGTIEAAQAQIDLVDLPFVRLQPEGRRQARPSAPSFAAAVARRARMLEPRRLEFELDTRIIRIGTSRHAIELQPTQFALYWLIARCWKRNDPVRRKDLPHAALRRLLDLAEARQPLQSGERPVELDQDLFDRTCSRINAQLDQVLDSDSPYHVRRVAPGRYGLGLRPEEILEPPA